MVKLELRKGKEKKISKCFARLYCILHAQLGDQGMPPFGLGAGHCSSVLTEALRVCLSWRYFAHLGQVGEIGTQI